MTATRPTARTRLAARNRVLQALKDDHRRVKRAFRAFATLDKHPAALRQHLVERTCDELEIHTTIEHELFYPAARRQLGARLLLDEAEVEHGAARALIAQIRDLRPSDPRYAATFLVLGEYVMHHIAEEQHAIFPRIARAELDWEQLSDEITSRRAELVSQLLPAHAEAEWMPGPADDEPDVEDDASDTRDRLKRPLLP